MSETTITPRTISDATRARLIEIASKVADLQPNQRCIVIVETVGDEEVRAEHAVSGYCCNRCTVAATVEFLRHAVERAGGKAVVVMSDHAKPSPGESPS